MAKRVLVVDDDPAQRRILEETIKRLGFETKAVASGDLALQVLDGPECSSISLVLLDLMMPGLDGMGVLARLAGKPGIPPVIVQTANGSIDAAIGAMRAGAVDFVVKPASPERLDVSIKSALKIEALAGEITRIKKKAGRHADLQRPRHARRRHERVIALGRRTAASNIPVLIEGEVGVGKELIARAIQGESERRAKPFVTVNCGAIPENLVESILFGHEKGSFTGAIDKRVGKFQEADGGTLFLDEVGELPLDAQVKLLRALQEGEIDPVGAKKPVKRQLPADLGDQPRHDPAGERRQVPRGPLLPPERFPDLGAAAARSAGGRAELAPPLRGALRSRGRQAHHRPFAKTRYRLLTTYTWPGNVRQLENAVFRAVVLADSPELTVAEFPQIAAHCEGFSAQIPAAPAPVSPRSAAFTGTAMIGAEATIPQTVEVRDTAGSASLGISAINDFGDVRALEEIEADMIRLALGRYRGHMTEVAKKLEDRPLDTLPQDAGIRPRAAHELSFQRPARKRAFRLSVPFRTLEMLSARCSATTRHRDQTDLLPSRFTTFLIRLGFPVTTH